MISVSSVTASRVAAQPLLVTACYALAGLGILATWLPGPGPVRMLVVALAAVLCPGLAFTSLLDEDDELAQVGIAVGVGVATVIVVAQTMALAHWWHPDVAVTLLACASVGLLAARRRTHTARTAEDA